MRKNRGAFFENNANMAGFNPGPMGFQANNYSSFYQGPAGMNMPNLDIEERLAKIERQLNRLEYRLTKVENSTNIVSSEDFDTNNSNMYML